MAGVLSQDEVNALLQGLDGDAPAALGPTPQAADDDISGIRPYNLGSNDHVNWGRLPSLRMSCEKFGRTLQEELSHMLLAEVAVEFQDFLFKPFQEFVDTLPMPSSFTICRLEPLQGHGILIQESPLVVNLVDLFFGGRQQTHVKIEGRDFTPIERHIIHKVSTLSLGILRGVWENVHPISFEYLRTEVNPQFAMVIAAADMALCCQFTMEILGTTNSFYIVFPYSSLEPIKEKLASIFKGEGMVANQRWIHRLNDRIAETPLRLTGTLGHATVTVGHIRDWQVGDVLVLDNKVTDPLQLMVEGVPKFVGYPGQKDGYVSFQIHGVIDTINKHEDNHG